MSKLFKLKDWLTVPEAARHLTTLFDEPVSESDVLRLALERRLTLSIYFVNQAVAKKRKLIPWTVAERVPSLCGEHSVALGQYWDDEQALVPDGDDEVQVIDGVFDLTMNNADWLDVERRYHRLTGGPECELIAWDSAVVRSIDGQYWALEIEASKLLGPGEKGYYVPLCGLPDDGVLVVRTSALQELYTTLSAPVEKPITTTERNTFLKLLIGMAVKGYSYDPKASKSTTPKEIADDLAGLGITITDDTVRKHLKEAALAFLSEGAKPSKPKSV